MDWALTEPPLVSIILPFYNAAETLAETLDSILAQTLREFELLLVDDGSTDGSTDGSVEIVRRYAQHDPRIRLFQPGRQGVSEASNYGLRNARCELVARMDADDLMSPQRLESQYRLMSQRPDITLCGTQVQLFPEEIIQQGFREYIRWQNNCTNKAI